MSSRAARHVGIVEFSLTDLLTRPAKYAAIVERMTIVQMRADLSRDRVVYQVWHPSLRSISEGEVCPTYDVTVYDGQLMFSPREATGEPASTAPTHHAAASS